MKKILILIILASMAVGCRATWSHTVTDKKIVKFHSRQEAADMKILEAQKDSVN